MSRRTLFTLTLLHLLSACADGSSTLRTDTSEVAPPQPDDTGDASVETDASASSTTGDAPTPTTTGGAGSSAASGDDAPGSTSTTSASSASSGASDTGDTGDPGTTTVATTAIDTDTTGGEPPPPARILEVMLDVSRARLTVRALPGPALAASPEIDRVRMIFGLVDGSVDIAALDRNGVNRLLVGLLPQALQPNATDVVLLASDEPGDCELLACGQDPAAYGEDALVVLAERDELGLLAEGLGVSASRFGVELLRGGSDGGLLLRVTEGPPDAGVRATLQAVAPLLADVGEVFAELRDHPVAVQALSQPPCALAGLVEFAAATLATLDCCGPTAIGLSCAQCLDGAPTLADPLRCD